MLYFLSATEMHVIYTAWEISVPPSFSGEILSTRHVQKNHRMAWAGRFFQILLLQSFDPSASVKKKKKKSNLFLFIQKWPLKSWWNCVSKMYTLMNLHICMGFVRKEQGYFLLAGIMSFSFMEYNVFFFQRHEIKSLLPKAALCGSWFNFSWKFCHGLFWKVRCCWGCRATHLFHMNGGKFRDWLMRFSMVF